MTTRICCIGTSHLGCLKSGWEEIEADYPGISMTFFGAPNAGMTELISAVTLSDGSIVPRLSILEQYFAFTSGGQQKIRIADYDAFIVIGCGVGLTPLFDIYEMHRSRRMDVQAPYMVSEDCIIDSVSEIFLNSTASRFVGTIRSIKKVPVFVIPDPRPSAATLDQVGSPNPIWDRYIRLVKDMHSLGDGEVVCEIFRRTLAPLANVGANVIDASGSLITQHVFTPHEFCRDSIWLQNGRYEQSPTIDFFHMNGSFGARILRSVIETSRRTDNPPKPPLA